MLSATNLTEQEPAYIGLLEAMGERLGLTHRSLKMGFSGFKIARARRGDSCDRLREA